MFCFMFDAIQFLAIYEDDIFGSCKQFCILIFVFNLYSMSMYSACFKGVTSTKYKKDYSEILWKIVQQWNHEHSKQKIKNQTWIVRTREISYWMSFSKKHKLNIWKKRKICVKRHEQDRIFIMHNKLLTVAWVHFHVPLRKGY